MAVTKPPCENVDSVFGGADMSTFQSRGLKRRGHQVVVTCEGVLVESGH
jgi:hypothetical protein